VATCRPLCAENRAQNHALRRTAFAPGRLRKSAGFGARAAAALDLAMPARGHLGGGVTAISMNTSSRGAATPTSDAVWEWIRPPLEELKQGYNADPGQP